MGYRASEPTFLRDRILHVIFQIWVLSTSLRTVWLYKAKQPSCRCLDGAGAWQPLGLGAGSVKKPALKEGGK